MRKFFIFLMFAFLISSISKANPWTDTLQGYINTVRTLDATKIYLMIGEVHVQKGGTIVIPPGTKILGHKPSKASLIIERGGKIFANGTVDKPVIFTSQFGPGLKAAGDWGGIVLLGRARINTTSGADTASIEGYATPIYYGGQNDDDSSGVMSYVRIEYAGIALAPNNEINSLTMGGVGRKTVIEYIMCTYGGDDAFEWFGGTVNCKYLVAAFPVDDYFDIDNGFRGNVQFCLGVADPLVADISGSNGFESDNNGAPNYNAPRTQPVFSNVTLVGPKQYDTSTVHPDFRRGMHLRRNSLTSVYNTIWMGWLTGTLFDGSGVGNACNADTIKYMSNIIAGISGRNFDSTGTASTGFNPTGWALTSSRLNDTLNTTAQVQLSNPYGGIGTHNYTTANFMPNVGSPALDPIRATNMSLINSYFTPTTYRGAFGLIDWGAGWTNFRPDTVKYTSVGITQISSVIPEKYMLNQNYPNPFNPSTKINFSIPKSGMAALKVFDITGRLIDELVNQNLIAGEYEFDFLASGLTSGVYFYTLSVNDFSETKKMLLIK